ncbi:cardiolipin synthetase [Babesia ovis]|uniref:Cardiolipin synthetase n=1 Tax=Babesia ovis TaxID=5869 RepID=A0A9W5TAR0_BABOV|nr:cardiolipin synthetase [Babesia ovis]
MVVKQSPRSVVQPCTRSYEWNDIPRSHQWSFVEGEARRILKSYNSYVIPPSFALNVTEVTKWVRILSVLAGRLGRMSGGNEVLVCTNGDISANKMLDAIDKAVERVFMEVYIFDDSPLAARFVTALKNAAKRGCKVILVVDYVSFKTLFLILLQIGSFNFPTLYHNELTKEGVEVLTFNPVGNRKLAVGTLPFRNHKKILLIDNHTAFCGSMNISMDSTSQEMGGNGRFHDVNVQLRGPVVCDLAEVFKRTLEMSSYNTEELQCIPINPIEGGVVVQVLESDVSSLKRRTGIQSSLATVLSNAEHSVYLTTSYFYPPGFLRRSLSAAIKRNVDIHMLLSGNSDIPGDINATMHVLRKFFKKKAQDNFKVFMTTKEHCHGKYIVVDDVWSSIGSFNWDRWSSRRNLEVSVGIFDPHTARKLKDLQHEKETESIEYTRESSLQRPIMLKLFDSFLHKLVKFSGRNCFDGLSSNGFKSRFKRAFLRTFVDDNAGEIIALSNMAGV